MIEVQTTDVAVVAAREIVPGDRSATLAGQNPARVYLARLAPSGRAAMEHALNRIVGEVAGWMPVDSNARVHFDIDGFPWARLRYEQCAALRSRLLSSPAPGSERPYALATVNQTLSALRGVLREAWRLGQITAEEYARATDFRTVKNEQLPKGRGLSSGEFVALVEACKRDAKHHGKRDAALLAVLYVGGLRRAEAAALALEDWEPTSNELRVRAGKGRRDRLVFLANGAAAALGDWLQIRGSEPGPLFRSLTKSGKVTPRRLTTQTVQDICRRRAEQARVKEFTPHDLRRSCASDLLDSGEDIVTVQRHLGHASPTTTARYDRRGNEALKRAATRLHFPY